MNTKPEAIKILSTGGTIDKYYAPLLGNLALGAPAAANVLTRASVTTPYQVEMVLQKDSLEITEDERDAICERIITEPVSRIIVTHGTDTMINTARLLAQKIKPSAWNKTVLFTGAMVPDSYGHSDAAFNIGFAFAMVQMLPPGIYVAMNGEIFDPFHVRKNHENGCFETL